MIFETTVQSGGTRISIPPGRRDGFAAVTIGRDGTCIVCAAASLEGGPRVALGCVAATQGEIKRGRELFRRGRRILEEAVGARHPDIGRVLLMRSDRSVF